MARLPFFFLCLCVLAGSARSAQRLVVYSPHGGELLEHCETRFEQVHPDVDVRWLDMGSQEILDRLRAEANRPRADVWFGAPATTFMTAAREDLLAAYSPTWAAAVGADRGDGGHAWYGTFLTPEVILYNDQRLQPEEVPRSFQELLDPRYEGQVILREPLASGTMRTIFGALVMSAPDVETGLTLLARLDAVTVAYAANPTLLFQGLARGRGTLTLWNLPDAMLQRERYGYPFAYRIPEGGTPVLVDGIAVVKSAPHPKLARAFYEFVTTPALLAEMAHAFYRIPVREDLDLQTLPAWMRQPIPALPMDWERLSREGSQWMNEFDRRIKGRGRAYLQEVRPSE